MSPGWRSPGRYRSAATSRRVAAALLLCCYACLPLQIQAQMQPQVQGLESLPPELRVILAGHQIPTDTISIVVQAVDSPEPLLSLNAGVARNPASTMKLLTTWLALEELGPAYTWPTEVYLDGELDRGVLNGDLILKGYGDPWLVTERLWSLQRELRLRGLRSIRGDLVIDNGYFADEYGDPGAFDGEGLRVYNVLPDALLVNFQAVQLNFFPDRARNEVRVAADPMPSNLLLENRLRLAPRGCGGFQGGVALNLEGDRERNHLILSGNYGEGCREFALTRSVLTGPGYAYGVFRSLWLESGGILEGELRLAPGLITADPDLAARRAAATLKPAVQPFARIESPPLATLIGYVNKFSNNVMSRHLLLTLGAEAYGAPATLANARRAARAALERRGLDFSELRIDNGAGLSRDTRIAASSLTTVLLRAAASPWAAEFIASLSLAGLDGTLRRRFVAEDATGRMHLKTGRLDDVYATAGYVHARSGRDYVVVILQNFPDAHRGPGEEAQTALLRWVYEM